ncbi:Gfo/Idh/MocA family oxidoreductase [Zunongwangia sp. F363]|uniref:Gfo/Idh/MocA family oxidoreductase n=1 Tax=Autumnicola tepida TaxID=3075595 RepID=A0ABU3CD14_9FLAO|nr:Gfo/Idh/MocA family oxidoreductase [Zunongwangia sp. F363]MDT0644241.1 Gfo/Idh/MocA family oxidoreductase [Zunongwangia sp. F363]
MNKKIRIGVLGTANIAMRSVVPILNSLKDKFEFIGVATRDPSKVDYPDYNIVKGYDALIEQTNLDAVYIPLPNAMHYEWVKKSLKKGLHVLVEKSLACNYEEVKELNFLAKEKNLVLLENFQFRTHSQLKTIREILDNGVIGKIRILRSTFCFPPFPDKTNIRYRKDLGGGALLDAGAYPVRLSQLLLGKELEVTSAVLNFDEDLGVDIWGGAFLKQKNGSLFSQIAFGFDNYYQCNLEVVGSKGKLYTNRIFTAKEDFTPTLFLETNSEGLKEVNLKDDNHFKNMLIYFYTCILGDSINREEEYDNNISQAYLLQELRSKAIES